MDEKGNFQKWLYVQPEGGEWGEFIDTYGQLYDGRNGGAINWSPDGKFLTFTGTYMGMYTNFIFRVDVQTGEIVILADKENYNYAGNPSWGALEAD
ncbi:MAG: hypothetical protein RBT34_14025 [Anaerolineaceae bacterium]|jgi:Tol biopolymer transport system component|nr:hypothetical protein [Anaerolineaceae bacterium]